MADIEKGEGSQHSSAPQYHYSTGSPHLRQIANPAPLGLFSFASTTLILSFINVQARGVSTPNIVVGMAIACGGFVQLLAGMWEFTLGNTFGATAFSGYGAFWISFGLIYLPGTGIISAYEATPEGASQLHNAVAIYLMTWFIFTFLLWLGSLRSTLASSSLFFFLAITFMMLMIGEYTQNVNATKAGGGLGILTAAIAYYGAASGIINPQHSYFFLPVGDLPKRH